MGKFKFKLNSKGIEEFLCSENVQNMIDDVGMRQFSTLPEGYGHSSGITQNSRKLGHRAKFTMYTDTIESRIDNSKNNTLLNAIGGRE